MIQTAAATACVLSSAQDVVRLFHEIEKISKGMSLQREKGGVEDAEEERKETEKEGGQRSRASVPQGKVKPTETRVILSHVIYASPPKRWYGR